MKALPFLFLYSCCIFCFLLGTTPARGQDYTTYKTADRKVMKQYERGRAMVKAQDLESAAKYFRLAIREDETFIDGYIRLAEVMHDLGQYTKTVENFRQAIQLDSFYSTRIYYALAVTLVKLERYQEAAPYLKRYLTIPGLSNRQLQVAEELLANVEFAIQAVQHPVPFTPKKLPSSINTPESEYLPSFTADESMLVYTAVRNGQEDFYYSEKLDGQWQTGQPIIEINTFGNEGAQSISADGKVLVFTACDRRNGFGSCDLFISYKREGVWSPPINMGRTVNSSGWDAQPSLSADGRFLFFASRRGKEIGGSDIYVTYQTQEGVWSAPQNLGPVINTAEDDQSPFFHPDGRSLYFMSKGHPGMGGFDLFVSRLEGDGKWSTPKNLGYPINTRANEGALVISLDGQTAYFATDLSKEGDIGETTDIYSFPLYEAVRPNPVTYLKAIVVDAKTQEPLRAGVELYDIAAAAPFYTNTTDEAGSFLVCLPAGINYGLNVTKEGYLFQSEHFELAESRELHDPYLLKIELQPVTRELLSSETEEPEPIILKNVFFATGSADLLDASLTELNRLRQLLEDNPSMRIQINGHTDDVGSDEDNLELSQNRAKAVYNYLVQEGIDAQRLSYRGFGETQPITTNTTPEGRQQNRRTEFVVVN